LGVLLEMELAAQPEQGGAGSPQAVQEVARNDDNKCKRRGRINRKKSKVLKRNGRRPKNNQAK
jgi:hypothetical protein